jgi:hypothetical protein
MQPTLPQIHFNQGIFPQLPDVQQMYQIKLPQLLELSDKSKDVNKKSEIKITKKEVTDLLTQDSYYRKLKQWPLLKLDDIIKSSRKCEGMFSVGSWVNYYNPHQHQHIMTMVSARRSINSKFPGVTELLIKFKGHLVACGGAVVKSIVGSIFDHLRYNEDIDLFFYDLNVEEANKMRLDAIEFLVNYYKNIDDSVKYYVKRNEYTTTLCIPDEDNDITEYQFIHRIYPDMSSIIGGFDLSICMVAFDGTDIYATPLGAWSVKNASIIIDTKRRSTSFEYRLQKYYTTGFQLIFPGLSKEVIDEFIDKESADQKMINEISAERSYPG